MRNTKWVKYFLKSKISRNEYEFLLFFFCVEEFNGFAKMAYTILWSINALPTFCPHAISKFIEKILGEYLCIIMMCATIYST